jgi:flagellar basal body rod protein FlgF
MNLEHVSGLTPLTAQEALEMVRLASGMLQSAAVCLEENMQDLTAAERRDLQAELEMMRVFKRNLEACLHFERHIAPAD